MKYVQLSRVALSLAGFLLVAAAHAQTYRWTDADGNIHHTDKLPSAESGLRSLEVTGGRDQMSAFERRTVEIINETARAEREALPSTFATPPATAALPGPGLAPAPTTSSVQAAVFPEMTQGAAAVPVHENLRDPCLRSWDPACYQKHAKDYDPRYGYAPSIIGSTAPAAADSSRSSGAR